MLMGQTHAQATRGMESYGIEGYGKNPVVYACVDFLSNAFARIPLYIYDKNGEKIEDHPLQKLLDQPNSDQGGVEYKVAASSWLLLTGNCFQQKLMVGSTPSELMLWEPQSFTIERQKGNPMPLRYIFGKSTPAQRMFDVDRFTGQSDIIHWRTFNPDPREYEFGQSPMKAASLSVDGSNESRNWNFQSLKNSGSYSLLVTTEKPVTPKEQQNQEQQLYEKWAGPQNANKIKFMGSASKVQSISMTAKDMEWSQGLRMSAQEICMVYGVPSQLIGLDGSQTYANYEQAQIAVYVNRVLPLLDLFCSEITRGVAYHFGEGLKVGYNQDDIPALEPLRRERRKELLASNVLSINQKLELIGYPTRSEPEADQVFVQPSDIPLDETFADPEDVEEDDQDDQDIIDDGEEE